VKEEWKVLKEYPNYAVSNLGRIKSLPRKTRNGSAEFVTREKILTEHYRNDRAYVNVYKNKKQYKIFIHQQVALNFVPNPKPEKYTIINHIDENKKNNKSINLEWCDYSYNLNYGSRKNFQKRSVGQWLEFKNIKTGRMSCCHSKSDLFKILGLNSGGSNWRKLNRHIENDTKEFYGYKVIQYKKQLKCND